MNFHETGRTGAETIKQPEQVSKQLETGHAAEVLKSKADSLIESSNPFHTFQDQDLKELIDQTPTTDSKNGSWEGERGESKFVPKSETALGAAACQDLDRYGLDGIVYSHGVPDFSPVAEGTVKVEGFSENRPANFKLAYEALSERWNQEKHDGRSDWTPTDIRQFKKDNNLVWHECLDMETMQLIPESIHKSCSHLGGISKVKNHNEEPGTLRSGKNEEVFGHEHSV